MSNDLTKKDPPPELIKRRVEVHTQRFITCPACNRGHHAVEHLFERIKEYGYEEYTAGSWWCDYEDCGVGFNLIAKASGEVLVDVQEGHKKVPITALLRILPTKNAIYLVVRGMRFINPKKEENARELFDHKKYFYEEHTCPSNYLNDTETVIISNDADPHGLASLVGYVDGDARRLFTEGGNAEEVLKLFGLKPESELDD